MTKATLRQKDLDEDPNLLWNAFIDLVAFDEYEPLSEVQQWAHYCFTYDGQIQNGGHLIFFENYGLDYALKVLVSLENLALSDNLEILRKAYQRAGTMQWVHKAGVEEYVQVALTEPFREDDDAFYNLEPDILNRLQDYAARHMDQFFEVTTS